MDVDLDRNILVVQNMASNTCKNVVGDEAIPNNMVVIRHQGPELEDRDPLHYYPASRFRAR